MEVDDEVKEDIQEEDMVVEEITQELIKTKSQLTWEVKQAIIVRSHILANQQRKIMSSDIEGL